MPVSQSRILRAAAIGLFATAALFAADSELPLFGSVDELRWKGPTPAFEPLAARLDLAAKPIGTDHTSTS